MQTINKYFIYVGGCFSVFVLSEVWNHIFYHRYVTMHLCVHICIYFSILNGCEHLRPLPPFCTPTFKNNHKFANQCFFVCYHKH